MSSFHASPNYRIVKAMKAAGNRPGILQRWIEMIMDWAKKPPFDADKAAVIAWLPFWQTRPYYTAEELAPLFPVLAVALRFSDRPTELKSPGRLANELKMAGLPHFMRDGKLFFVVEQCHRAREFENALD